MRCQIQHILACASIALFFLGGCRTLEPQRPPGVPPDLSRQGTGYAVWYAGEAWHLVTISREQPHRFQGSVSSLEGKVELRSTRPEWKDRVAVMGRSVHFDLEAQPKKPTQEISLRVTGGCARFDLYLDGRRRPERVHIGPRGVAARHIPFDHCP